MITISKLRHAFPETQGLVINREKGYGEYTFLHFFNSVKIRYKGEIIETHPHAVIIYDVGTPQYFSSETSLVHDWVHFSGDISELLKNCNIETDKIYYPSQSEFITSITKEMETEFYGDSPNKDSLLEHKISELFIKLGRAVSGDISPVFDRATKEKFRYLRGEMLSKVGDKWSVCRMAKTVGFSQSRFYSIYKSIYGITPTADLIGARIEKAKNMLVFGNLKIEQIAESLGYDNTTHFIRQFKKEVGISPSAFRKINKIT